MRKTGLELWSAQQYRRKEKNRTGCIHFLENIQWTNVEKEGWMYQHTSHMLFREPSGEKRHTFFIFHLDIRNNQDWYVLSSYTSACVGHRVSKKNPLTVFHPCDRFCAEAFYKYPDKPSQEDLYDKILDRFVRQERMILDIIPRNESELQALYEYAHWYWVGGGYRSLKKESNP